MSCSGSSASSPAQPEADPDDPLCITDSDRRLFSESGAMKRKAATEDDSNDSKKRNIDDGEAEPEVMSEDSPGGDVKVKVEKTEEPSEAIKAEVKVEDNAEFDSELLKVEFKIEAKAEFDSEPVEAPKVDVKAELNEEPSEKLKSENDDEQVETEQPEADVKDEETEPTEEQEEESEDKSSVKKDKNRPQNLRKNIKDVLDDTQLDATTLAAQRQESERLARVQEQQRLIREAQRQIEGEKKANKFQQKILSILQPTSPESMMDPLALSTSMSSVPSARSSLHHLQSLISDQIKDSDDDSDDDVVIQPIETKEKSAVVVDSSSDSDDCIILSDEEEEDVEEEDENNSGEHTNDHYNQKDAEGRVIVNIGHGDSESNIYVAPQIARIIKPHQIGGVRFLFDNIIESVELFEKSTGFGCILAHSMGLGKTLQLVCFCDIFLRHTSSKSILIIMPINTLQNWLHEFNMWLPLAADVDKSPAKKDGEVRPRDFNIFVLNDSQKTLTARAKVVLDWSKEGGVLMMGYEMYRLLSLKKAKKKKRGSLETEEKISSVREQQLFDNIHSALVSPGPDLVVCDEGHRIKNAHASTSLALKQIRSKRRVVLTGYPLQNNLLEYWCMVDFVRPNYLGTKTEFSNMFERPIQNGQCLDSTPSDCKLMRYRAHVLHSLLKGFVQRRSHMVLQKCLPEKTEFVLLVRMTPFQRKLYSVFMDEVVRSRKVPNPLKAFAVCCKIWNHPDVLYNFLKKRELDLDLELEEAEPIGNGKTDGSKKRGRKSNESKAIKKEEVKPEVKPEVKEETSTELQPVKLESAPASSTEPFKQDSAYSSSQSVSSSFDSSSSSYNSYPGSYNQSGSYESGSYQNYNYNNGGYGGYGQQNWNGSNYWQNNYYPSENNYSQGYYQQNSYQQGYGGYGSSNYQNAPIPPTKLEPGEVKPEVKPKLDGGLLSEEISEELQDKNSKEKADETETKDVIAVKSSKDDGIPYDWAVDLMKDYIADVLESSPKMEIFFCILEESLAVGDRLLVFSQSLLTLNILERFLQKAKVTGSDVNWAKNTNYFRLDGSTAALEREKLINEFNSNTSVKLFLVSTRAGSLGINLVGANRVVVFDASWNPCHDTQAVCRVYRYGQAKSCFVYRFVMDNCLEKKIYDRQINKQGMADRVVDECNPDAHLSMREVTSLCYDDGEDPELKEFNENLDKYSDLVMKKILESHSKTLTKEPFQHESLLVDRKEKKLSLAEKRLAQRGYEMEKQAASKPTFNYNPIGSNYRAFRTTDGSLIHRPVGSGRPAPSDTAMPLPPVRPTIPRPTRWVPVEVWQSKGLTAQEMTLPQDVSIQTNSADKSKIYLKAGQKVIVLKSPKGICLQLESGKVIAIRASVKNGPQGVGGAEQKLGSFVQDALPARPNVPVSGSNDVIDISNDDDDDEVKAPNPEPKKSEVLIKPSSLDMANGSTGHHGVHHSSLPLVNQPIHSVDSSPDTVYKEKTVYKPNLVQRKPKVPIPPVAPQDTRTQKPYDMNYQHRLNPPANKWENYSNPPPAPGYGVNGAYKPPMEPYRNPAAVASSSTHGGYRDQPGNSSAFHPPAGAPSPYPAPPYPTTQPPMYQNSSYSNPSYPAMPQTNYGYPYHNASYPNAPPSYQYSQQSSQAYDQNYPPYQGYNSQLPPTPSIPTDQTTR